MWTGTDNVLPASLSSKRPGQEVIVFKKENQRLGHDRLPSKPTMSTSRMLCKVIGVVSLNGSLLKENVEKVQRS